MNEVQLFKYTTDNENSLCGYCLKDIAVNGAYFNIHHKGMLIDVLCEACGEGLLAAAKEFNNERDR